LDTIIAPSTVQSRNFQSVNLQSVNFQSCKFQSPARYTTRVHGPCPRLTFLTPVNG